MHELTSFTMYLLTQVSKLVGLFIGFLVMAEGVSYLSQNNTLRNRLHLSIGIFKIYGSAVLLWYLLD